MRKQLTTKIELLNEQAWCNLGQGALARAVLARLSSTKGGMSTANQAGDLLYFNASCTGEEAATRYQRLVERALRRMA